MFTILVFEPQDIVPCPAWMSFAESYDMLLSVPSVSPMSYLTKIFDTAGRDIEYVKQFFMMECSWYGEVKTREIFDIIEKTYDNDDIVLFGINCDGDYYWINSRQNMIDNLMGFGKKEENA